MAKKEDVLRKYAHKHVRQQHDNIAYDSDGQMIGISIRDPFLYWIIKRWKLFEARNWTLPTEFQHKWIALHLSTNDCDIRRLSEQDSIKRYLYDRGHFEKNSGCVIGAVKFEKVHSSMVDQLQKTFITVQGLLNPCSIFDLSNGSSCVASW